MRTARMSYISSKVTCLFFILFHIEYGLFTRALISYFSPMSSRMALMGFVKDSKSTSRCACVSASFDLMSA